MYWKRTSKSEETGLSYPNANVLGLGEMLVFSPTTFAFR